MAGFSSRYSTGDARRLDASHHASIIDASGFRRRGGFATGVMADMRSRSSFAQREIGGRGGGDDRHGRRASRMDGLFASLKRSPNCGRYEALSDCWTIATRRAFWPRRAREPAGAGGTSSD